MSKRRFNSRNSDITAGIVILVIGGVLLLKALGIWFPSWVFSWPMILIAIGVISLVKNKYQSGFGVFMILLGSFFLIKRYIGVPIGFEPFLIPAGLILLGLYLIAKRRRNDQLFHSDFFKANQKNPESGSGIDVATTGGGSFRNGVFEEKGDFLNAQALFTGIQKRVLSKSFRGGKASAIFGGTDIDLSQADLAEGAVLNVEVAFGGVKLIVPPHWDLQIDVTNIFAGIEDKRMYSTNVTDTTKVLKIYGSIIFGGLEIKSF